ncbi:hypothetical protein HTZ84_11755 [Haloterrigena sp. SYSU A558-1]|uniref:Twin-arginine translocation signal domain-containing protein n=1 Tax=Haloterrigena gelatinilytica TaxID=2741724 RepID=A0ABX2LJM5_9EURY|nr:hypothetical protein [Haloterrigena gelatinilytica]NUC72976.1 hypothetical protein [Haloterrigena gelatinilytica]
MTPELTRREAVAGIGGAVAVGSAAGPASASDSPADAVVDLERDGDADYPRCLYKPDSDDEWNPVLPINIHAQDSSDGAALSTVEDGFTGFGNLEWTRVFPDATARAWDGERGELVRPDHSFRRPRLGDAWNHVHIWAVDEDRVAIHAHLDVVDVTASHFHRGDRYGDAAAEAAAHLAGEGWETETPYSIEYGVEDDRLERWGDTGDVKLIY